MKLRRRRQLLAVDDLVNRQVADRQRAAAAYQEAQRQRRAARMMADLRAEVLLLKHCNEEQKATWRRDRYICITGSEGGAFCLHDLGDFCRVFEHDEQQLHTYMYCSYLAEKSKEPEYEYHQGLREILLPIGDQILAHKFSIETNEVGFRMTAPRTFLQGNGLLWHPHGVRVRG